MAALLQTLTDAAHLHYAVQSRIYAEFPSIAFVTARGHCGRGGNCSAKPVLSPGAAVSAMELMSTSETSRTSEFLHVSKFRLKEGSHMGSAQIMSVGYSLKSDR